MEPGNKADALLQRIADQLGLISDDLRNPDSALLRCQDQQRDLLEAFDRLTAPEARDACIAYVRTLLRDQA